ncbi:MAG: YaaA family protein [Saprospiraceae bacterium]|jgi:cytoplasmic iron level regulating protein YaaA (DUF328/UPF0246 family)|nr:YaaA family protein [Saprospiraceae bacterium]
MVVVLSPSKGMSSSLFPETNPSSPFFLKETTQLLKSLRSYSAENLQSLMHLSEKLASQTYTQFQKFQPELITSEHGHACLTYTGDVYSGLLASQWTTNDIEYGQSHLLILSALYGVVSPLTAIQPYRLEMGLSWKTPEGSSLYSFWAEKITAYLQKKLIETDSRYLLQLASDEYAKCFRHENIGVPVIEVSFFERKNGKNTFVSFHAKKARGMMASYVIQQKLTSPEQIRTFNQDRYEFDSQQSTDHHLVFYRENLPA